MFVLVFREKRGVITLTYLFVVSLLLKEGSDFAAVFFLKLTSTRSILAIVFEDVFIHLWGTLMWQFLKLSSNLYLLQYHVARMLHQWYRIYDDNGIVARSIVWEFLSICSERGFCVERKWTIAILTATANQNLNLSRHHVFLGIIFC